MAFDSVMMVCVDVRVSLDELVEDDENLLLHLETDDSSILLVEPTIAVITIINSDGERTCWGE